MRIATPDTTNDVGGFVCVAKGTGGVSDPINYATTDALGANNINTQYAVTMSSANPISLIVHGWVDLDATPATGTLSFDWTPATATSLILYAKSMIRAQRVDV